MLFNLILLVILSTEALQIALSSSTSADSSPQTSETERMLPSDYDERERSATKALYRLHKTDDHQMIIIPANKGQCGSVKNPHTMRCPHWPTLNRQEKQKNRSRLRLLVVPDRIRLLKNSYAKKNMARR